MTERAPPSRLETSGSCSREHRIPDMDVGRGGQVAFAAVAVHGLVVFALRAETPLDPARLLGLLTTSALYLGMGLCARAVAPRMGLGRYALVINVLAVTMVMFSGGHALLAPLPPLSVLVSILPRFKLALVALLHAGFLALALDGSVPASVVLTMLSAFVTGAVFVIAFTQVAVRERLARAELAEVHQKLSAYAAQAEQLAVVQERNRLARELHDSLGHYLTVIHVQLEAASSHLELDRARAQQALNKAARLTREGLADVRRSVGALRGPPLQAGSLVGSIRSLVEDTVAAGVRVEFATTGLERRLSPAAGLALYRAAQEALTNVRKHSQAESARVELAFGADAVQLQVQDTGCGLASGAALGFGLLGVRERAELLGGALQVDSQGGLTLTLTLPASP